MIFDALSNAAHCVSLRGPEDESEGGDVQTSPPGPARVNMLAQFNTGQGLYLFLQRRFSSSKFDEIRQVQFAKALY